MRTTRMVAAALAALLLATLTISVGPGEAEAQNASQATYYVELTNLTDAQYLTPPNFAAHVGGIHVFQKGAHASAGVQAVAENGGVPVLAGELTAAIDDAGLGVSLVGADAPIAPGATVGFEVTTAEEYFSLVSMVICTNDGFGGIDSRSLPKVDGATRNYNVPAFDAGTEINTEMRSDLVGAPFCGDGPGNGASDPALAEGNVIQRHRTLRGVGDLDPALDWSGPVAELSITRVEPANDYTITLENITSGQYLTPPNFAAHAVGLHIFQRGHVASPGVQAVAENGGVPVLAAELMAAIDDQGLGVSGVGADAPIPPGASVTFDVSTMEKRLSLVSMVICTNDGFAGVDSRRLPGVGETATFYVRALDAGTEINTEMRSDLVGAPFCGDGPGSGSSDPALAEGGVIARHRTLKNVGDLDPALDWRGPVAVITVTNNG